LSYWNDLYDCLRQRTKYKDPVRFWPVALIALQLWHHSCPELPYMHQVVEAKATPEHPLYVLRTPEEAQKFWKTEFGHLESPSAANQPES